MIIIEDKIYSINGKDIKFKFVEFFNDFEMFVFFVGELFLSVIFFLSFGNVSIVDCSYVKGIFGFGLSKKWKLWVYDKRVVVVREVEKLKK